MGHVAVSSWLDVHWTIGPCVPHHSARYALIHTDLHFDELKFWTSVLNSSFATMGATSRNHGASRPVLRDRMWALSVGKVSERLSGAICLCCRFKAGGGMVGRL